MPSLILETPADGRRIIEGEKWLQYIYERYNISQQYYNWIEFIFRQCLMHERFNTGFAYGNEEPVSFPIKKDKFIETLAKNSIVSLFLGSTSFV